MGIKSFIGGLWAKRRKRQIDNDMKNALNLQKQTFQQLIQKAKDTHFGKDHGFDVINTYEDFQARVPVRDYEQARTYFDRIYKGETDVSWPGKPVYLAKTSGTTSGAKYIPISNESIKMQIGAARDALLLYMGETGENGFSQWKNDVFVRESRN